MEGRGGKENRRAYARHGAGARIRSSWKWRITSGSGSWRRLNGVLLRNLEKALGEALVTDIDFRPMPRAPHAAAGGNGAAGIAKESRIRCSICSTGNREKQGVKIHRRRSPPRGRAGQSGAERRRNRAHGARSGRYPDAHRQAERARYHRRGADGAGSVSTPRRRRRCARIGSGRRSATRRRCRTRRCPGAGYFKVPKVIERMNLRTSHRSIRSATGLLDEEIQRGGVHHARRWRMRRRRIRRPTPI